ncbi:MAG: hypothetical protein IJT66_01785 [Clostridia bacterium]|nr:hypothetical protein [Clostridia bacterium]
MRPFSFQGRNTIKKVGIVTGIVGDLPVVQKAMDTLVSLGIPYEAHVLSAQIKKEKEGR